MSGVLGGAVVGVGLRTPSADATANTATTPPSTPLTREQRMWLKRRITEATAARQGVVQDGLRHGRQSTYRDGCRCDACREAATEGRRERRRRMRELGHFTCLGTRTSYDNGCRCWECRSAAAAYRRLRKSAPVERAAITAAARSGAVHVKTNGDRRSTCPGSAAVATGGSL